MQFLRSKKSLMKCLDHGRDEPTPDYREMQLENFLDSLPQVLEDCNNKKRKAPVLEYLPPPPPIPCHMHHEVQGPHTTMGSSADTYSATGPRSTQVHGAMKIAANTASQQAVPPATMSKKMESGDARQEFAREQHARSTYNCDDSTKPLRTQRVEGTTWLAKGQPKLDMSQAWKHRKPLRALPPPVCKENETSPGAAVANITPNPAALKSHIRIAFQPRPAAGRRVQQQPPPRYEEKPPQSMPEVVAAESQSADMNPPSQTPYQQEEATGAQRKVQEDGKVEVTITVSKAPSGVDTIDQAIKMCKASEIAAVQSEQAPLLATCRWISGEDAWQEGKLQGVPEGAQKTADSSIKCSTDDANSTEEGAHKPANDPMNAPQRISSVDPFSTGQNVQSTCTAVQANLPTGAPGRNNASMCGSREGTVQQLGQAWVCQTLKQSCAADRAAVQADEAQDNPVMDTDYTGRSVIVDKPIERDQEDTQQRACVQESQIPSEHVNKRQTKQCTSRSTAAVQTKTSQSFLADEESFTWCDSYGDLEDGVQFTLEELVKFKLLYPDSISEMCLSKLAALRSYQQHQAVCTLYDAVTQKKLTKSVDLFLWDTIKTLPVMPYCLLAPSVQEMAKSTMEKAANCDRIRGKLNNHCWSRLASSSEAVQYEVFKDINNAISKPEWQLDNLSIWTKNCIHRQTARLRRSAKKATEFTTSSGGLGQTTASATPVSQNDSWQQGGMKYAAPSGNKQWRDQSTFKGKRHIEKAVEPAGGYAKRRRYH